MVECRRVSLPFDEDEGGDHILHALRLGHPLGSMWNPLADSGLGVWSLGVWSVA